MTSGAHPRRPLLLLAARPRGTDRLVRSAALAALALCLVTFVVPTGDAQAAAPVKSPTVLELQVPATVDLGAHPLAHVRLTSDGAPVSGQLISVRLGTHVSQQVVTGPDGSATADIARDLPAGRYRVVATFAGTTTYRSASSATLAFTVKPVELTIATVPAMPDMTLVRIGRGAALKTGADGTVRVTMTKVGEIALHLALQADGPTQGFRLARWDDGSTEQVRTIRIPDTLQVTVGLNVLHPVRFEFTAPGGTPIDAADVPVVRISDSAGTEQTLAGPPPYWLRANSITRQASGLVSAPLEYRIVSVPLDGAEVVNRGQQRFVADRAQTVDVQLLVFYLTIGGRDALLKTPSGSTVTITSAAGATQEIALDGDAQATVRLPRGEYRIVLAGGPGFPLSTPVALSRDQAVDLLLVSFLDIGLAVAAGLVLALGLIVIGRPHVLRRKKEDPPSDSGDADPPVPTWPASPPSVPRSRGGP